MDGTRIIRGDDLETTSETFRAVIDQALDTCDGRWGAYNFPQHLSVVADDDACGGALHWAWSRATCFMRFHDDGFLFDFGLGKVFSAFVALPFVVK